MDDPLWFTLADEPCSGLGSETVLSEDGLCYRINLSPAKEVRPNNSPRLVPKPSLKIGSVNKAFLF